MSHITAIHRPAFAMLVVAALGACGESESPFAAAEPEVATAFAVSADATVRQELAELRRATAHLHQLETAIAEGWDTQVTECVEHATDGGMGYHYASFDLYLDGEANFLEPEVLLYEPQEDGHLRLVAVEYAVPFFAWAGDPEVDDPPVLFGQSMKRDDAHGEWVLHVWIWAHNPSGMFEDWNPNVSCEFAS